MPQPGSQTDYGPGPDHNQPAVNTGNLPQPAIPGVNQHPSDTMGGPTIVSTPSDGHSQPTNPANPYNPNPQPQPNPEVAPPEREASPYDFFMSNQNNPNPAQTGKFGLPDPKNPSNRFALIAGGGGAVILIIVMLILFIPSEKPKSALVKVNQQQIETLRICELGKTQAKDKTMRNFATNCSLTQTSDSRKLTAYLQKTVKVKADVLALGINKESTDKLKAAQSATNYDDTFKSVMASQLNVQGRAIQSAAQDPDTTNSEKKLLAADLDATKLLIKQLNQ